MGSNFAVHSEGRLPNLGQLGVARRRSPVLNQVTKRANGFH
jgi:hypothetical protein